MKEKNGWRSDSQTNKNKKIGKIIIKESGNKSTGRRDTRGSRQQSSNAVDEEEAAIWRGRHMARQPRRPDGFRALMGLRCCRSPHQAAPHLSPPHDRLGLASPRSSIFREDLFSFGLPFSPRSVWISCLFESARLTSGSWTDSYFSSSFLHVPVLIRRNKETCQGNHTKSVCVCMYVYIKCVSD